MINSVITLKKCQLFSIPILFITNSVIYMSTDIHLAAQPQMMKDLNTSELTLKTIFFLSYIELALFSILWGLICNFFGKKETLLISIICNVVSNYLISISSSVEYIFWSKFIQCLCGGAVNCITLSIIYDKYKTEKKRAKMFSILELLVLISIILAPIMGAFIQNFVGWRYMFLYLCFFQILLLFVTFILFPKYKNLKEEKFYDKIYDLFLEYRLMLSNKLFMIYVIIIGFIEASWIIFVSCAPFIFINEFKIPSSRFPVYYSPPLLFYFIGLLVYNFLVNKVSIKKIFNISIMFYIIWGIMVFTLIIKLIPATPFSISLLMCYSCIVGAFILPTCTSLSLNFVNNQEKASLVASIIGVSTILFSGIITFLSTYFFSQSIISMLLGIEITILIVGLLALFNFKLTRAQQVVQ